MATLEECRAAIDELAMRLARAEDHVRAHVRERSVSCRIIDLDVVIRGNLTVDGLTDVTEAFSAEPAQIRLTMASDDLIALVDGELAFAPAWASGRIRLDAPIRDLLRLRSLLS